MLSPFSSMGAQREMQCGCGSICRGQVGWTGRAAIPAAWLPEPVGIGNAYAIHGPPEARRYRALHPVPGEAPDFHRLECFGPIGL